MKEFMGAFIKFTESTFMKVIFEIATVIVHGYFVLWLSMHYIKDTAPITNAIFGCFIGLLEFIIIIRTWHRVNKIVTKNKEIYYESYL